MSRPIQRLPILFACVLALFACCASVQQACAQQTAVSITNATTGNLAQRIYVSIFKDYVGIFIAIITAGLAYHTTKRHEDRTRRIEAKMKHLQRQIEELYGPLYSLVRQIFIANHVQYALLDSNETVLSTEQRQNISDFFQTTYFIPLHSEIISILKTKLYLAEGADVPDSFYYYQKHAIQERIQRTLWLEKRIDTSFVSGEKFPDGFFPDIEQSLKKVMAEYEEVVQSLK